MLWEIGLGFSGSSSSSLKLKSSLKYNLWVVGMVRKEMSVHRFSKTMGLYSVQVDCPLCICVGYGSFLIMSFTWRTHKMSVDEHVLLLKTPTYVFLIQNLSVIQWGFVPLYLFVWQATTSFTITLFPQVCSKTSLLRCGLETRRGSKGRIHFSCYFSEILF